MQGPGGLPIPQNPDPRVLSLPIRLYYSDRGLNLAMHFEIPALWWQQRHHVMLMCDFRMPVITPRATKMFERERRGGGLDFVVGNVSDRPKGDITFSDNAWISRPKKRATRTVEHCGELGARFFWVGLTRSLDIFAEPKFGSSSAANRLPSPHTITYKLDRASWWPQ